MAIIEQLGAYVSSGVRGKARGPIGDLIRFHVVDTAAAWVAGARSAEGKALLEFAAALGQPLAPADEVMIRCAATRLSEVDDIHLSSGTTPGSVVVPAALTLGNAQGAGGEAIAEAILAGYEAMVRLGAAFNGPSILYRGIWPTYFTAPLGVAAVASRLFGLDDKQSAHALALALVFSSPGVGHPGGPRMGRWIALGHAARHGVMAAMAARAGFSGDVQLLEKDFFTSIYAIKPELSRLTEGLGVRSMLEGVSFKPWCAARQTIAASQAMKEFVRSGLKAEDITAVCVAVPPPYLKMVDHGVTPGDRSSYLTSAPCQVALSVLDPGLQFSVSPQPERVSPRVLDLIKKVSVQADEALLQHFPQTWPARVRVTTPAGSQEKLVLHVPGDPERPFDEPQLRDKFTQVVSPLIGERPADALWSRAIEVPEKGARGLVEELERAIRS
jgi:2-methylcitrate dehydratase PrpD